MSHKEEEFNKNIPISEQSSNVIQQANHATGSMLSQAPSQMPSAAPSIADGISRSATSSGPLPLPHSLVPPSVAAGAGPSGPANQPFMPPGAFNPAAQMPPYYWGDWWGNYGYGMPNPSAYDPSMAYRDDFNKSQVSFSGKGTSSTIGVGSTKNQPTSNQAPAAAASQYPPMMPPPPFLDPSLYYAQMALHMAQMAPVNPYFPMGPTPYGPMAPPYAMSSHHHHPRGLPDDQQSIQSFHFDLDTRSEKKLHLINNRPQSVAGGSGGGGGGGGLKTEPEKVKLQPPTGLLIMEETPNLNLEPNVGLIESVMIKRVDENRLTPQLHQLPHVRASFSLNSLLKIRANDPCEGQPALVDILNLSDMMEHYLTNLRNLKINESDLMADQDYDVNASDISEDTQNEILTTYRLLQEFPGPLVRETTAKAQVIQFCQKHVKECLSNSNVNLIDPQSHALLWDYLALLVRQNGLVDLKTDISPLLLTGIADANNQWVAGSGSGPGSANPPQQSQSLTNASAGSNQPGKIGLPLIKKSPSSSSLSALQQQQDFVLVNSEDQNGDNGGNKQIMREQQMTKQLQQVQQQSVLNEEEAHMNKLRQLLGAGQKTNAIDLAIKYNMWSHALFLASSFNNTSLSNTASIILASSSSSSSSQANQLNEPKLLIKVKNRFINSLQPNDPIHTCYQLLTGRVPSVASNVSKSEWNDWRRHLAMIVSNIDDNNRDLVFTTIKTMGDSLASNGQVAASHFCYLLSNCPFGTYNKKSSKLVLIGSSHNQDFNKFCQISAIQATEIYEFANSLSNTRSSSNSSISSNGILEHFVKYKLIYVTRLLEHGLINEAYKYIEVIAKSVNLNPKLHSDKISAVFQLSNRLKIYDPDFNVDDLNNSTNEPGWLQELTNNYKKLHLNKLWYLLPSSETKNGNEEASNVHLTKDNSSSGASSTAQISTPNVAPIDDRSNAAYAKHEPASMAEPMSQYQPVDNYSQAHHYQQQVVQQPELNTNPNEQLNYDMNRLNLGNNNNNNNININNQQQQQQQPYAQQQYQEHQQQQQQQHSMPFVPENQVVNSYESNSHDGYYQPNQTNTYDAQLMPPPQQPVYQPQQGSQYFNPNESTFQSRKSSIASVNQAPLQQQHGNAANTSSTTFYDPNANQTWNKPDASKQRNLSSNSTSELTITDHYQNAMNLQQQHQQQQQQYQGKGSGTLPRSRQSSVSTSYAEHVPFTPFVPYQPTGNEPQQQFYDPGQSAGGPYASQQQQQQPIQKSQTFPVPNQQSNYFRPGESNDQINDGNNQVANGEDNDAANKPKTKPKSIFDEDDEDQFNTTKKSDASSKSDNSKLSQQQQQQAGNKGIFSRALDYFKPASNAPKKMVLPDDRKKTIVWDDKLKRYVNKDGSQDDSNVVKPPPMFTPSPVQSPGSEAQSNPTSPDQASMQSPQLSQNTPNLSQSGNRFSLKSMSKQNYYSKLDILSDPTKKVPSNVDSNTITPMLSNMPPPSQIPPRFFVPEPQQPSQQQQQPQYDQQQNQQNEPPQQLQQQQQQQPQGKMFTPGNVDQYYDRNQMSTTNNYQPGAYQGGGHAYGENNYSDENDSATTNSNSNSHSNESAPTSSSNESNYMYNQQQQQQQYYSGYQQQQYQYQQPHSEQQQANYDTNNSQSQTGYAPEQYHYHSNI